MLNTFRAEHPHPVAHPGAKAGKGRRAQSYRRTAWTIPPTTVLHR